MRISFHLNTDFKLVDRASFEEVCNSLQSLTSSHLYIDENKTLRCVEDVIHIHYGECELIRFDNGFVLQELEKERRIIRTFSIDLMLFLTTFPIGTDSSRNEEDEIEFLDDNVIIFPKSANNYYKNKNESDAETETKIEIDNSEAETETETKIEIDDSEAETETETKIEIDDSEAETETETKIERDDSETETKTDESRETEKIWFRLFSKNFDDDECLEAVYINKKMFKRIEDRNEIDFEKTIKHSFSTFLKKHGFESEISVTFYENVFGEVLIESSFPLSNCIIEQIEDEAHLNLCDETVFFVFHGSETYLTISNNLNKIRGDDIYSKTVSLHNLPVDLVQIINHKLIHSGNLKFNYDSSKFSIENEGDDLYSLFDHDLLLPLPHLDPSLYLKASIYSELPIAQFYH